MLLRQALDQTRAVRSEAAANLSLWDAHQRTAGHPSLPSWQVPSPRPYTPPKRAWADVRRALLGHLLQFAGACLLAGVVLAPLALHLG